MIGYGKKINRIYNGPPYMRGGKSLYSGSDKRLESEGDMKCDTSSPWASTE